MNILLFETNNKTAFNFIIIKIAIKYLPICFENY